MLSASGREKSLAGPRARGDVVELSVSGMDGEMYHRFFGEVPADGRRYCRGRVADGVGLTGIWTGRDPSAGEGIAGGNE